MTRIGLTTVCIMVLAACSGGGSSGGGGDAIAAACAAGTNMPKEACECLGEQADERLSPEAAEWLATAMRGETDKARAMKDNIAWTDLLEAGTFMMNSAEGCAIPAGELPEME